MFGRLGGGELIIILVILLLLFGARKLPDLARSLGASAKEFRKGVEQGGEEEPPADAQATKESQTGIEQGGEDKPPADARDT